jgi:hypothetical protein
MRGERWCVSMGFGSTTASTTTRQQIVRILNVACLAGAVGSREQEKWAWRVTSIRGAGKER